MFATTAVFAAATVLTTFSAFATSTVSTALAMFSALAAFTASIALAAFIAVTVSTALVASATSATLIGFAHHARSRKRQTANGKRQTTHHAPRPAIGASMTIRARMRPCAIGSSGITRGCSRKTSPLRCRTPPRWPARRPHCGVAVRCASNRS
ncbi:hypothetical protein [Burkholderia oklahomensis]|uniref:hypothetical protein n=1 Tax=Burkholderia oklahomensis TaxID=342113 RepID=UPI000B29C7CD|nr:hypothetical protein [Burkholderia oklahomensis]